MIPAVIVAVPSILGMNRLPKVARRATDQTEAEKRAVTGRINKAAGQLADLWDADRRSTGVHLPDLRGYLSGLTGDSVSAATRPLEAIPSQGHASSRPGPPARPGATPRSRPRTTCPPWTANTATALRSARSRVGGSGTACGVPKPHHGR